MKTTVLLHALWAAAAQALSADDWRSQSIYQIITDRFARTDGSTTASCNLSQYCGGTWRGIIDHLDYIQGMGFTAVSHAEYQDAYHDTDVYRSGSRLLYLTFLKVAAGML
jgi:hypothetical protein